MRVMRSVIKKIGICYCTEQINELKYWGQESQEILCCHYRETLPGMHSSALLELGFIKTFFYIH